MSIREDKPGREKEVLRWKGIPVDANKGDFGNPVDGETSIAGLPL